MKWVGWISQTDNEEGMDFKVNNIIIFIIIIYYY